MENSNNQTPNGKRSDISLQKTPLKENLNHIVIDGQSHFPLRAELNQIMNENQEKILGEVPQEPMMQTEVSLKVL